MKPVQEMPVIQLCRLLPHCSWGPVYQVRSKDCICFKRIYLTSWVPSRDWPETLVLQAVYFLVPCGKVDAMWPQLLVLCVGSNCILPCKWAFIKCLTSGWPQRGGEVIIALIASFSVFPVVWWRESEGNLLFPKFAPVPLMNCCKVDLIWLPTSKAQFP